MSAWVPFLVIPLWTWDLRSSDDNLVFSGEGWGRGIVASGRFSGTSGVGTGLSGRYWNDASGAVEFVLPDVTTADVPMFWFRHAWSIADGDRAAIEAWDGAAWTPVAPVFGYSSGSSFSGDSSGWHDDAVDLRGLVAPARLRLAFDADATGADAGWIITEARVYDGDALAPRIELLDVPSGAVTPASTYTLRFRVVDDVRVDGVDVVTVAAGATRSWPAVPVGGDAFVATVAGPPVSTVVDWYVVAYDAERSSRYPTFGSDEFRVAIPPPQHVAGPAGRVVGNQVRVQWEPPAYAATPSFYRVYLDGVWETDVAETAVELPVETSGRHAWQVSAQYEGFESDLSEALWIDVEVPEIVDIEPAEAWPGDRVRVRVEGESVYFDASVLHGPTLGDGIVVESAQVLDVDRVDLTLAVAPDAMPGSRDLAVSGAYGSYRFPGVFVVNDPASAPHIVSMNPMTVTQGDRQTLTIVASMPFAGPVTATTADGAVVTAVRTAGAQAEVDVVVAANAKLGTHVLLLDDGERIWQARFAVDARKVASTGCAHAPGPSALLPLVAAVWFRRRANGRGTPRYPWSAPRFR